MFLLICAGLFLVDAETPQLPELLERLDQVSELYSDQSLGFTCNEKVVVDGMGYKNTHRFRYLYVLDENGRHVERRVPSRKPAKWLEHRQKQSMDELPNTSAYSWVFLFQRARRNYVRYEVIGKGERLGREAIGIRFEPVGEIIEHINEWIGVAWVDAETLMPLEIEARRPAEYAKLTEFEASLDLGPTSEQKYVSEHLVRSVRVKFGDQLRGLRFPTVVSLERVRYTVSGGNGASKYREKKLYSATQTYTKCEFFEVTTTEEFEHP